MTISQRRQFWLYPIFQVPLMCLIACLLIALLGWLLSWGKPPVGVAIALDLSDSTRGMVRQQEIQAVKSYLDKNEALKNPNQITILGFADRVQSLTTFQNDSVQLKQELDTALQNIDVAKKLGGGTNLTLAIQEGINTLSSAEKTCRELLLITDGEAQIKDDVITDAINQKVKINAVVLSLQPSPEVQKATIQTKGAYLTGTADQLESLFITTLFTRFNSNIKWVAFWLGGAFIFLMWAAVLPLDRWLFQRLLKLPMNLSGQLALAQALFWTILTLILVSKFWGLPFGVSC